MGNDKHKIVIQDTCILFDLVDLSLLGDFFQLGFAVFTTPQVINEIHTELHKKEIDAFIKSGELIIDNFGSFQTIIEISKEFPALSLADSSVLELAKRKNAVLFSADGSLRKISTRKNIIVHGTLWIVKELHARKILSTEMSIEKLELYLLINERAPKKEIRKMISYLNKS